MNERTNKSRNHRCKPLQISTPQPLTTLSGTSGCGFKFQMSWVLLTPLNTFRFLANVHRCEHRVNFVCRVGVAAPKQALLVQRSLALRLQSIGSLKKCKKSWSDTAWATIFYRKYLIVVLLQMLQLLFQNKTILFRCQTSYIMAWIYVHFSLRRWTLALTLGAQAQRCMMYEGLNALTQKY